MTANHGTTSPKPKRQLNGRDRLIQKFDQSLRAIIPPQ